MKYAISIISIAIFAFTSSSSNAEDELVSPKYAIKAGKILTMAPVKDSNNNAGVINNGIILVSNGKIKALGPASSIKVPKEYTVINARDRWVMPGIVESHSHFQQEPIRD